MGPSPLCVCPLPRPIPLRVWSYPLVEDLSSTAIWSGLNKIRVPWDPEDPEDFSPAEIPPPGPDVQDGAFSPTTHD